MLLLRILNGKQNAFDLYEVIILICKFINITKGFVCNIKVKMLYSIVSLVEQLFFIML